MSHFYIDSDYLKGFDKIGIAFSGGLDSTVLLNSIIKLHPKNRLIALHINHGVNPESDDWEIFCRERACELGIEFKSWKIEDLDKISEESLRNRRLKAFEEWASKDDLIITGHHSDDQVETVLFRIFRGTGLKGVRGIEKLSNVSTLNFYRPLIDYKKEELLKYARKNDLIWIEDDSNKESNFSRNLIRNDLIPKIKERWPFINKSINKISNNAAKAQKLLLEIASEDLKKIKGSNEIIKISKLKLFSSERQENLIFYWLTHMNYLNVSSGQMVQILSAISKPSEGTSRFFVSSAYGTAHQVLVSSKDISVINNDLLHPLPENICINWNLKEPINIPSGKLSVKESLGKGLDKQYIEKGAIIKARIGGEKCKPFGRNKSQKIKNLFQEFEVPDWKRDGIPIIYINERIAAVGDLWVCEEFHTSLHEKGVSIIWNQMIS